MTTLIDRLWERTTRSGACRVWTGSTTGFGYGHIAIDGRNRMTHRVAYELLVGPIPEGLELDHLCRNRSCWNPSHLEPVTHAENVLRGTAPAAQNARKTHCPKGHPYDEANTIYRKWGRRCRACHNAATSRPERRRQRTKAAEGGAPDA